MRILKGWTKEERKELEEAKDNGFGSAILLIKEITSDDDDCIALTGKYTNEYYDADNRLARDIADYYAGEAKFAEPKKYYVHLIKGNENSYLSISWDRVVELNDKIACGGWKNKFTRDEVIDIDPRLVPFMEEVKDDE